MFGFGRFGDEIICKAGIGHGSRGSQAGARRAVRPIALAWYALVLPSLLLNYFGQGAFLLSGGASTDGLALTTSRDSLTSGSQPLQPLRESALALGVRRWRTIVSVVLPTAMPGILTGILLLDVFFKAKLESNKNQCYGRWIAGLTSATAS